MLTKELKIFLHEKGADLVGIAPADRMREAPAGHRLENFLPGTKTVISLGVRLNRTALNLLPSSRVGHMADFVEVNNLLGQLAFNAARYLMERGIPAIPMPYRVVSTPSGEALLQKTLQGEISQKHVAAAAGLGLFGLNNLVLTPLYGPGVRFGCVLTCEELEPDPIFEGILCKGSECKKCVEVCPVGALNGDTDFNPLMGREMDGRRCFHYFYNELGGLRCGLCISVCPLLQGDRW